MNSQWKKFIFGCVGGNILELYEFIIYGYFASIIGSLFFSTQNHYTSLMAAFAVFATGSIVRPFSSIIFGHIGDKLGRRFSLIISVGIMAVSTLCIGLLPTYSQIGITAPVLLIICRIGQGLSMTSEEVGAALFLMENAPNTQKGYAGSLVLGSVYLGLLFGSVVSTIIFSTIYGESLLRWGWRIPFLIGGIVGIIILIIRINQPESYEFKKAALNNTLSDNPLIDLFKENLLSVIRITLLFCLMGTAVYLFAVFIPNVLNVRALNTTKHIIMLICSFGFFVTFLVSLCIGKLTDKIGSSIPLSISCLGFIIFSYPIFSLITNASLLSLIIGDSIFAILLGLTAGSIMLIAMKSFPVNVRFSGSCLAFNLSMSIFGGTAPLCALYLTKITHSETSPALLLIIAAGISLIALFIENKTYQETLYVDQICRKTG